MPKLSSTYLSSLVNSGLSKLTYIIGEVVDVNVKEECITVKTHAGKKEYIHYNKLDNKEEYEKMLQKTLGKMVVLTVKDGVDTVELYERFEGVKPAKGKGFRVLKRCNLVDIVYHTEEGNKITFHQKFQKGDDRIPYQLTKQKQHRNFLIDVYPVKQGSNKIQSKKTRQSKKKN